MHILIHVYRCSLLRVPNSRNINFLSISSVCLKAMSSPYLLYWQIPMSLKVILVFLILATQRSRWKPPAGEMTAPRRGHVPRAPRPRHRGYMMLMLIRDPARREKVGGRPSGRAVGLRELMLIQRHRGQGGGTLRELSHGPGHGWGLWWAWGSEIEWSHEAEFGADNRVTVVC